MGMADWFGLGSAIKSSADPIKALGDLYTTDKARIEADTKLQEVIQKPQLAQMEINRLLAISKYFFHSGWMPMLGWTSGFLIMIYYFPQIMIATYVWGNNCLDTGIVKPFPMKPDDILNLVYLLCLGGAHNLINKKT